ncbi:hypothetical protein ACN6MY_19115 [Peribacillus sp. B-H-3]|uniref:hypothetical protein n=1 Tax=Peribacillus sp. B-H-3 TaxID=3400420 RepID=UPI003B0143CC
MKPKLKQKKFFSMIVLVLEDNSSRLFFETLGGEKIDIIEVSISRKKLNELVYGWNNIRRLL